MTFDHNFEKCCIKTGYAQKVLHTSILCNKSRFQNLAMSDTCATHDATMDLKARVLRMFNATPDATPDATPPVSSSESMQQIYATKGVLLHESVASSRKQMPITETKTEKEIKSIPAGLLWCLDHRAELLRAGWTLPEIFSRQFTRRIPKPEGYAG